MNIALAAHGGAWNIPDEAVDASREGVRAALESGWRLLKSGATALDVVQHVVGLLEDDPTFDAGRGSRLNDACQVEMDAAIMEGAQLRAGAVAAIRDVRHPIEVARRVMDASPHVMLVGEGACRFARNQGFATCTIEDLLVGRELKRYRRVLAGERDLVDHEFDPEDGPLGTVGAVARDRHGNLAAATSTGGTQNKLAGRVGDTPVLGAGTYADNAAGAGSATGWGEGILRVLPTKTAVDLMGAGKPPLDAGRAALKTLDRVRGKGGLILLDATGLACAVFNTPRMARGIVDTVDGLRVGVEPTELP